MIQSLYTSITGMKAYQEALSVTSNNIANSQTVGFKKQKAIFDDLLYQNATGSKGDERYAGTNPRSVGSGVKLSGVNTDYTSGSLTLTGGKTDVAIEGNGLFLLGDANGSNFQYTRKGTFNLSSDFRIVNGEGKYVLGYPADQATGKVNLSGNPQPIEIPMGTAVGGIATTSSVLSGNLPMNGEGSTIQFPFNDAAGNKLVMELQFTKGTDGEYSYTASVNKGDGTSTTVIPAGTGTLKFNEQGELMEPEAKQLQLDYQGITVDIKGLTNYPTEKTMKVTDIDGRQAAIATDYSITDGGYVMIKYSDGTLKAAAQLAVATFPNEKGLMKVGNGNYVEAPAAGTAVFGASGQNGAGQIRGGATESSNVDLSAEFVDLMVYQRGFQGNSKVIKVADDIMNEIVNLIR